MKSPALGTFAEYVVVERNQVILAPDYLDDIHLAAWPLGGVTAWRYHFYSDTIFLHDDANRFVSEQRW